MTPAFLGTIREGKLFLDKAEQFKEYLHTFPSEKRVEVSVEKLTHPRTNQQNRYYFGVVVKEVAKNTGYSSEQVHELLKALHAPRWYPPGKIYAVGVPHSSKSLDTIAFVEYTEKCRVWAAEFLGINLPLPNEVSDS